MMLIGLTGKAGSGKSTAAQHLVENHGFTRLRFAGPLKAMMKTLFVEMGVDLKTAWRAIEGDLKEYHDVGLNMKTTRHAMQTLGTEWGRKCMGEDFWVNVARQRIQSEYVSMPPSSTPRLVFDDVRFENEAAMIREMGGTVIHITGRGGIEGSHASEAGVEVGDGDFIVNNAYGLNQTTRELSRVLDSITAVHDLTSE